MDPVETSALRTPAKPPVLAVPRRRRGVLSAAGAAILRAFPRMFAAQGKAMIKGLALSSRVMRSGGDLNKALQIESEQATIETRDLLKGAVQQPGLLHRDSTSIEQEL
jgi:hypothetical protein